MPRHDYQHTSYTRLPTYHWQHRTGNIGPGREVESTAEEATLVRIGARAREARRKKRKTKRSNRKGGQHLRTSYIPATGSLLRAVAEEKEAEFLTG
jgi:hypothetical protein